MPPLKPALEHDASLYSETLFFTGEREDPFAPRLPGVEDTFALVRLAGPLSLLPADASILAPSQSSHVLVGVLKNSGWHAEQSGPVWPYLQ